ncbi:DUF4136 domain-containing protein [Brevundimonas sp.]|uniref:DUF4136 domain-containing protein n=1 Tax=Brevundimonas sp. TaxID=1871086 RepID=UPI00289D212B|nr:DUF4136 domain-containing protein [Brevundimonas sp.]
MARTLLISSIVAVSLAACASGPDVVTTPPTALPAAATTYRLIEPEPASATDQAVLAAVRDQLAAKGWRETRDGPAWRIEAAYAVRPQTTGAYSDASAREGDWLDAPVVPQWWGRRRLTHSLTLTLHGPEAAPGDYQASAATTVGPRQTDGALPVLAAAAVSELKP